MVNLYLSLSDFVLHQVHEHKTLIITLVLGMITGLVAQMALPGKGFGIISTVAIGIAGAWLGARFITPYLTFIRNPFFKHMGAAIAGAMILVILIDLFRGKHDEDKDRWKHG